MCTTSPVVPGLDLEGDRGLNSLDFELADYLYGRPHRRWRKPLGRGRESGRVKVATGSFGNILSRM